MKALKKAGGILEYTENAEIPKLNTINNILVKVYYAGICRTDCGVADGTIASTDGIILGHEFCGIIEATLTPHTEWKKGDCVMANPLLFGIERKEMCGKDCDGAFADFIAVPSIALVRISPKMLGRLGAYIEPIAAALAPFDHIEKKQDLRLAIFGNNRIASLTYHTAKYLGYDHVENIKDAENMKANAFDCIIETEADSIDACVMGIRLGGMLVAKSRSFIPTKITLNDIVMKEIRIQGAKYADFNHAVEVAPTLIDHIAADELWGDIFSLSEYQKALAMAAKPQAKKIFFKINSCVE